MQGAISRRVLTATRRRSLTFGSSYVWNPVMNEDWDKQWESLVSNPELIRCVLGAPPFSIADNPIVACCNMSTLGTKSQKGTPRIAVERNSYYYHALTLGYNTIKRRLEAAIESGHDGKVKECLESIELSKAAGKLHLDADAPRKLDVDIALVCNPNPDEKELDDTQVLIGVKAMNTFDFSGSLEGTAGGGLDRDEFNKLFCARPTLDLREAMWRELYEECALLRVAYSLGLVSNSWNDIVLTDLIIVDTGQLKACGYLLINGISLQALWDRAFQCVGETREKSGLERERWVQVPLKRLPDIMLYHRFQRIESPADWPVAKKWSTFESSAAWLCLQRAYEWLIGPLPLGYTSTWSAQEE